MTSSRFTLISALTLGIATRAPFALAQSAEGDAPASAEPAVDAGPTVNDSHRAPGLVPVIDQAPVEIRTATPGRRFEIRSEEEAVVARCIGQCSLTLPLGSYQVALYVAQEKLGNETHFDVSGPVSITVSDPNSGTADVGLAMGVVGPIVLVAGNILFAAGFCWEQCSQEKNTMAAVGVGAMLAGAVTTRRPSSPKLKLAKARWLSSAGMKRAR